MSLLFHNHLIRQIAEQYNCIPPQYTPIEYIENTASAFIITNYIPKGTDIRIEGKYLPKSVSGDYCAWFSAYTGENYRAYRILNGNSTTKNTRILGTCGRPATGGNWGINPIVDITTTAGRVPYEFALDYSTGTVNINGQGFTIYNAATGTTSNENTGKLQLFRQTTGGYGRGQFFWLKVYKNNVLVLDLIPVRSGSTGYMYDRVNRVAYGNSGSGSFTLGPDLYNKKNYKSIEYLQSTTNKEYIDTGINYNYSKNIKIEVGVIPTDIDRSVIIGNYTGSAACLNVELGGTSNSHPLQPRYYNSLTNKNSKSDIWYDILQLNNEHDLVIEYDISSHIKKFTSQGNTSYTEYSGTVYGTTKNLRLFYDYRSDANVAHPLKITYCKIYLDDVLVRDFIPVNVDNEGCMYDKVTDEFFRNGGSGAFTLGPEIQESIPASIQESSYDEELTALYLFGGQEINLGIIPRESTDAVEIDFKLNSSSTNSGYTATLQNRIFCADYYPNNSIKAMQLYVNGSNGLSYYKSGNTWQELLGSGNYPLRYLYNRGNRIRWKFDWKNKRTEINSVTITGLSIVNNNNATENARVFGAYNSDNPPTSGYIYSVKYWRNDELVRDMIPVMKSGRAYMFDKINSVLYDVSKTPLTSISASSIPNDFGYVKRNFQQVNYLEANPYWTSYSPAFLDTGIKVDNDTMVEIMCKLPTLHSYQITSYPNYSKPAIFGTIGNSTTDTNTNVTTYVNAFLLQYNLELNKLEMRVASSTRDELYSFDMPNGLDTEWHIFKMTADKLWVDNILVYERNTPMDSFITNKYLYLFASTMKNQNQLRGRFRDINSPPSSSVYDSNENTHFPGYLAYCRIWQNGTLVRDYSPGYVNYLSNTNNTGNAPMGVLYDNVSKVIFPSSAYGYGFGISNEAINYNGGINNDIIPIEFLSTFGGQYLDTDIILDENTVNVKLEFGASFSAFNSSNNTLMVAASYPGNGVQVYTNSTNQLYNQGALFTAALNTYYDIVTESTASTRSITINGGTPTVQSFNRDVNTGARLYIFGTSESTFATRQSYAKYYYFKVYVNGILKRDFVPLRVDNTGYMLDKISNKLFGNAGTNEFLCGPDTSFVNKLKDMGCLLYLPLNKASGMVDVINKKFIYLNYTDALTWNDTYDGYYIKNRAYKTNIAYISGLNWSNDNETPTFPGEEWTTITMSKKYQTTSSQGTSNIYTKVSGASSPAATSVILHSFNTSGTAVTSNWIDSDWHFSAMLLSTSGRHTYVGKTFGMIDDNVYPTPWNISTIYITPYTSTYASKYVYAKNTMIFDHKLTKKEVIWLYDMLMKHPETPDDIEILDEIYTAGNAVITTDYIPNSNTHITIKCALTQAATASANKQLLGSLHSEDGIIISRYDIQYNASSKVVNTAYASQTFTLNTMHVIQAWFSGTTTYIRLDTGSNATGTNQYSQACTEPLSIFGFSTSITDNYRFKGKFRGLEIYESGVLARYYVPAKYNDIIGLYESTSGTFIYPTSGVLYDQNMITDPAYQQVEYISNPNQAILQTGYYAMNNYYGQEVKFKASTWDIESNVASLQIGGFYKTYVSETISESTQTYGVPYLRKNNSVGFNYQTNWGRYNGGTGLNSNAIFLNIRELDEGIHSIKVINDYQNEELSLYFNDVTEPARSNGSYYAKINENPIDGGAEYKIFGTSNNNLSFKGNIYYYIGYDDNRNKLFHFIPCKRVSDNTPGFYNIIRGEFITSTDPTRPLVAGPNI